MSLNEDGPIERPPKSSMRPYLIAADRDIARRLAHFVGQHKSGVDYLPLCLWWYWKPLIHKERVSTGAVISINWLCFWVSFNA